MTAVLSSARPSTAVYFEALPLSIALIAAFLMLSGVSKSGSPAPRPITSRPAAFSARALSVTAMVAEGLTRDSESFRKAMTFSIRLLGGPLWGAFVLKAGGGRGKTQSLIALSKRLMGASHQLRIPLPERLKTPKLPTVSGGRQGGNTWI